MITLCGINELWANYGIPALAAVITLVGAGGISKITYAVISKLLGKFASKNSTAAIAGLVADKISEKAITVAVEPIVGAAMAKLTAEQSAKMDKILAMLYESQESTARIKKAISYSKLIPAEERNALLNGEKIDDTAPIEVNINDLIIPTAAAESETATEVKTSSMFA